MIDRSLVWTGSINDRVSTDGMRRRVGLYDTTLRDGEQTVGVSLDPPDKLEIARALDRLGIERIEAGFPKVSEQDSQAFEMILDAGLDAEIWGFSRALPGDVEELVRLGLQAAVIEIPVSDGKLDAYGFDRDVCERRVREAVGLAAGEGIRVCFFGVDGTRADPVFLERIYAAAVDAGAEEIALVDTLGIAAPEAIADLVSSARGWVGDGVPIHFHGQNDFGLATACSIAAVRAGADWIQGTVNGMGERAGNTDLGEFAIAVESLYGAETSLNYPLIREVASLIQQRSGYQMAPWKSVTGQNLFVRETGAVASQFHNPPAVEPYASELVGADRGIVLGKKSGLASIRIKLDELGLDVGEDAQRKLLAAVKERGINNGGLVSDGEFEELAEQFAA